MIAILPYLCREHKVVDHWYPKDSLKQAYIDEFIEWQHINIRDPCIQYFQKKVLFPLRTGVLPANTKELEILRQRMDESLDLLENIWLKDKPFLSGNEISISDIIAASEMEQPRMAGYDPYLNRSNLTQWIARVQSELSPFYEEAHQITEQISNEYKRFISELNKAN